MAGAKRPPAKSAPGTRQELFQLAADMVKIAMSVGVIPEGEAVRRIVRVARMVVDEVDHPTKPPKPAAKKAATEEYDEGADLLLDDSLEAE